MAGEVRVRYQPLPAVDHIGAVGAASGRAEVQPGAVVGLGQRERNREIAARDAREQLRALLLGSVLADRMRERVVDMHERANAAMDLGELGDDRHVLGDREGTASVGLGHEQPEHVHLP